VNGGEDFGDIEFEDRIVRSHGGLAVVLLDLVRNPEIYEKLGIHVPDIIQSMPAPAKRLYELLERYTN